MAPAPAVAFVAGATGFVGRAVIPALVARGAKTIAHVRPDSSRLDEWKKRFAEMGATVDATPWEAAALGTTMKALAVTHVFCLIGTTRGRARSDGVAGNIYEAIDYGLTKLLLDASVAAGTRPRFVYLSSVGASTKAASAYLAARGRAEDAVRASGLPSILARPSFITGEGRDDSRPGERAAGVVADGVLAVAGLFAKDLRARYRSTTPEILGPALVRLAFDGAAGTVAEGAMLR